jgi:hypothetical protein
MWPLQAYGVVVCPSCSRSDAFALIAKSVAQERYLLTERDLRSLGFMTKPNPRNKQFAPVKLLLESQVAAVAQCKHGSLANVADTKRQRMQAKLASRVAAGSKRQELEGDGGDVDEEPEVTNVLAQRKRQALDAQYLQQDAQLAADAVGLDAEEI